MLRRLRQWFSGPEITALGRDLETVADRLQDMAHRVEGLQLRLDRLSNRVNMRLTRAGVPRADVRTDEDILAELGQAPQSQLFDQWPQ